MRRRSSGCARWACSIRASAPAPRSPRACGAAWAGRPVYPGTCRGADVDARARPVAWLAARHGEAVREHRAARLDRRGCAGSRRPTRLAHGDVVLARKDAPASYHLAVTLDDAADGVTHVDARRGPVRRDRRPPAAPGAARSADARSTTIIRCSLDADGSGWPSATARRRWRDCAPRGRRRARAGRSARRALPAGIAAAEGLDHGP